VFRLLLLAVFQLLLLFNSGRAVSVISSVYGFSTFANSSSVACFPSVADLPAAAVSCVPVLLAVSCQVRAKFGIAPSWV
jgi:hypothetical protein